MTAYLQQLESLPPPPGLGAAPPPSRLREYVAALPPHRRVQPFCLEQLCEALDAPPPC